MCCQSIPKLIVGCYETIILDCIILQCTYVLNDDTISVYPQGSLLFDCEAFIGSGLQELLHR